MKRVRATVDMIAVFRGGEVPEPYKFKYRRRDGKVFEIKVDKVVDLCIKRYNYTKDIIYTCKSLYGRRELNYELRYIGADVRWELTKYESYRGIPGQHWDDPC